jgi:fatty-acyl-CoA synthase
MRIEPHLARRDANFRPLTPVDFLVRAAEVHPGRTAVVWGDRRWSYRALSAMAERFRARLEALGVGKGDVVSVIAPNRPEMLAAHYAVPALGAVLNTINLRLDADTVGYILGHAESRVLVADPGSMALARVATAEAGVPLLPLEGGDEDSLPPLDLLSASEAGAPLRITGIDDEWQPLCLNYTSGTTGRPKGVVYTHRGAYLNALGNVLALGFDRHSVYLWTLPMFHCDGWCHTWAVTAASAVHVCLDRPDPALIFRAMREQAVTHFACAPVVLYMLLNHPDRPAEPVSPRVLVGTGGAAPTSALIEQLDAVGIDIIHLYGLTESYGPLTLCALPDALEGAPAAERAAYLARQGACHVTASDVRIFDEGGAEVPADGATLGEIRLRGNTLMAGYYRDAVATEAAFAGGWLRTGDLAVRDPDGAVAIRDRSKDIIISGGENISSIEIESALHQHPAVLLAAVVAAPHPKWGEIPCAFIELKAGQSVTDDELRAFCRGRLPGFKQPKLFVFRELPKTATGKVQKFVLREEAGRLAGKD